MNKGSLLWLNVDVKEKEDTCDLKRKKGAKQEKWNNWNNSSLNDVLSCLFGFCLLKNKAFFV